MRKKAAAEGWSLVIETVRETWMGFECWQRKMLDRIRVHRRQGRKRNGVMPIWIAFCVT
jgi:hypothetical protein